MIYCDKINDGVLSEQTKQETQIEREKKAKVILDKGEKKRMVMRREKRRMTKNAKYVQNLN